jgi:hypothetical protein
MKSHILGTACAALLATSAMVASGAAEAITVYSHLPTAQSNFISHHATGGPVLADDFTPVASGAVTTVTWWGSAATSDIWEITFHTDNNGVPNIDNPIEGGLVQHLPVIATGVDNGRGWLQYTATWSPMDLILTGGNSYWFSVANANDGWTWALAQSGGPFIGSEQYDAVVSTGALCTNGGPHCGPWTSLTGTDFAFLIDTTAIPIPAAVWLFGSGLLGLIGIARRKKAA